MVINKTYNITIYFYIKERQFTKLYKGGMDAVVTFMLQLRNVPAIISDVKIASHVHLELNNLLSHLSTIKDFDLCLLGKTLCSKGPLGREIVVSYILETRFRFFLFCYRKEITSRISKRFGLGH